MVKVLISRLKALVASEDGTALVATLATFMLMYMSAMGLYATGKVACLKLETDAAADAAAYAAASVEAESLSRIAQLNRALSWTHVQLTKKRMDFITWKWLDHVTGHYRRDMEAARIFANPLACPLHNRVKGAGWDISSIRLNRRTAPERSAASLPGVDLSGLEGEISDGMDDISRLNDAIDSIAANIPRRMREAVSETLERCFPDGVEGNMGYAIFASDDPRTERSQDGYLSELSNTLECENRLVSFSLGDGSDAAEEFGRGSAGSGRWFVRGDERESEGVSRSGATGIERSYFHYAGLNGKGLRAGRLVAYWTWTSSFWVCYVDSYGVMHHDLSPTLPKCAHGYHVHCQCKGLREKTASTYGDGEEIYGGEAYAGGVCHPLVLDSGYFGSNGTVGVAVARSWELPIASELMGSGGWMWAFSSAKAGVRIDEGSDNEVDWRGDGDWNLSRTDWRAVFVPVCRSWSMASGGRWEGAPGGDLESWANAQLQSVGNGAMEGADREMRAGGRTDATWALGNPGGRIEWNGLLRLMAH